MGICRQILTGEIGYVVFVASLSTEIHNFHNRWERWGKNLSVLKPKGAGHHSKRLLHSFFVNAKWITCQCRHAEYRRVGTIHVYTHMKDQNTCIPNLVVQGNESCFCNSQKVSNILIYKFFFNVLLYSVQDAYFFLCSKYVLPKIRWTTYPKIFSWNSWSLKKKNTVCPF